MYSREKWAHSATHSEIVLAKRIFSFLRSSGLGEGWKLKRTKVTDEQNITNAPGTAKSTLEFLAGGLCLNTHPDVLTSNRLITPDGVIYYLSGSILDRATFTHSFVQYNDILYVSGKVIQRNVGEEEMSDDLLFERAADGKKGYTHLVCQHSIQDGLESLFEVAKIVEYSSTNQDVMPNLMQEKALSEELMLPVRGLFSRRVYRTDSVGELITIHKAILRSTYMGHNLEEFQSRPLSDVGMMERYRVLLDCVEEVLRLHLGERSNLSRRLIHRDIKASNIFVSEALMTSGRSRLGDVEFAIPDTSEKETVRGTPMYLPPSVMLTHQMNFSSDLYALGITLGQQLAQISAHDIYLESDFKQMMSLFPTWNFSVYCYMKVQEVVWDFKNRLSMKQSHIQEYMALVRAITRGYLNADNYYQTLQYGWIAPTLLPKVPETQESFKRWVSMGKQYIPLFEEHIKHTFPVRLQPHEASIWSDWVELVSALSNPAEEAHTRNSRWLLEQSMQLAMKIYRDNFEQRFKRILAYAARQYQLHKARSFSIFSGDIRAKSVLSEFDDYDKMITVLCKTYQIPFWKPKNSANGHRSFIRYIMDACKRYGMIDEVKKQFEIQSSSAAPLDCFSDTASSEGQAWIGALGKKLN